MSSSDLLVVEGLSAAWEAAPVLEDVTFQLAEREFVVLLGPNGSGKTTLLRCLAGLEPLRQGRIHLRGERIDGLPPHRRGIGMLFQEPALFLHRTVFENVTYGLEITRADRKLMADRAGELLSLLHLEGFEDRPASALSGGERQRVALARTLVPRPALVLLDEPFASVDAALRTELLAEFREVLQRLETAAIHVTHDREEGLFLGDRVLVLLEGRLRQEGTPVEVFQHPRDAEVARFFGYNLLESDGRAVAVHPRSIRLVAPGAGRWDARVLSAGTAGAESLVFLEGPQHRRLVARLSELPEVARAGRSVGVAWSDEVALG